MPDAPSPAGSSPDADYAPNALPPRGARVAAFVAILLGGLFGWLIGWAFIDLQCHNGGCDFRAGLAGLIGAVIGAAGIAVVAVLALRASGEWRTVQHR